MVSFTSGRVLEKAKIGEGKRHYRKNNQQVLQRSSIVQSRKNVVDLLGKESASSQTMGKDASSTRARYIKCENLYYYWIFAVREETLWHCLTAQQVCSDEAEEKKDEEQTSTLNYERQVWLTRHLRISHEGIGEDGCLKQLPT